MRTTWRIARASKAAVGRTVLAWASAHALLVPSCSAVGGGCEEGETRCDGSTIFRCVGPCSDIGCKSRWESASCSTGVCVKDGDFPFCALSTAPDPECTEDGDACRDNTAVSCIAGFLTRSDPCDEPAVCVITARGNALCALSGTTDPRCDGSSVELCDGATVVGCDESYAVSEDPCPAVCIENFGEAFCALSETPDLDCGARGYCDNTGLVRCRGVYAIERQECRCVESEGVPYCESVDAG